MGELLEGPKGRQSRLCLWGCECCCCSLGQQRGLDRSHRPQQGGGWFWSMSRRVVTPSFSLAELEEKVAACDWLKWEGRQRLSD